MNCLLDEPEHMRVVLIF